MKHLVRSLVTAGLVLGAATLVTPGAQAADAGAGQAVYAAKCKSCHGAGGEGNAAIAKMMKVELKPLAGTSEEAVKAAVTKGVGKMKPVAGLAGADVDNVAAAVKAMKK